MVQARRPCSSFTHTRTYHYGVLREKDFSHKPSFDVLKRIRQFFDDGCCDLPFGFGQTLAPLAPIGILAIDEVDFGYGGAAHLRHAVLDAEIVDLRPAGGIKRAVLQGFQYAA